MKNIWKKYKEWMVLTLFLILGAAIVFFIAGNFTGKIKNTADDIQRKIIDSEVSRARTARVPEMRNWHDSFWQKGEEIQVILSQNDEVEFIKRLEFLAEETGNSIELKISEEEETKKKTPAKNKKENEEEDIKEKLPYDKYLAIEITLLGQYQNLLDFVHKMENMNYYINLLSLDSSVVVIEEESQASNMFSSAQKRAQPKKEEKLVKSVLTAVVYLAK